MAEYKDVPWADLSYEGSMKKLDERLDRLEQLLWEGINTTDTKVQQLTVKIDELGGIMADAVQIIEAFRAAVEKELLDDKAQNDLIALLQGQVANADQLVADAAAGEQAAKDQLDEVLREIETQTVRLGENDLTEDVAVDDVTAPTDPATGEPAEPTEPGPEAGGDGTTEPAPAEPTEPAEPVEDGTIEPAPAEPVEDGTVQPGDTVDGAPEPDNTEAPTETADGEDTGGTPPNPFSI